MQASLCGTSKSMIFMSPPYRSYRGFEIQTWKKVVDADVVEVRQHQLFLVMYMLRRLH